MAIWRRAALSRRGHAAASIPTAGSCVRERDIRNPGDDAPRRGWRRDPSSPVRPGAMAGSSLQRLFTPAPRSGAASRLARGGQSASGLAWSENAGSGGPAPCPLTSLERTPACCPAAAAIRPSQTSRWISKVRRTPLPRAADGRERPDAQVSPSDGGQQRGGVRPCGRSAVAPVTPWVQGTAPDDPRPGSALKTARCSRPALRSGVPRPAQPASHRAERATPDPAWR